MKAAKYNDALLLDRGQDAAPKIELEDGAIVVDISEASTVEIPRAGRLSGERRFGR